MMALLHPVAWLALKIGGVSDQKKN